MPRQIRRPGGQCRTRNALSLVTLAVGPTLKMQVLQGLLDENGVPAFVTDTNLKTIDPFMTGALPLDARLQVPEEELERAREMLEEARAEATETSGDEPALADDPAAEVEDLGRRIRWAALFPWMHPFAFANGVDYLRALSRGAPHPRGHALNMVALSVVTLFWLAVLALALRFAA